MAKKAFFRFEASLLIGAGHVIRSCVIADELIARGWECQIITSAESYKFIKILSRFPRLDPSIFEASPQACDLLVIDHYDIDASYESQLRPFSKKIIVIDDLANRPHDCDILLDQTYGRLEEDYRSLVPSSCKILTGIDYVLLRKEIRDLRDKALAKRQSTKDIKRILITMGGSDPKNFTLQALEMIQQSGFSGAIDIVLGFSSENLESVTQFADSLPNKVTIHTNADMPQLMYEADLCIGAAGSGVWERLYLGLPSVLIQTAGNQAIIYNHLTRKGQLKELTLNFDKDELQNLFHQSAHIIQRDNFANLMSLLIDHTLEIEKKLQLRKAQLEDLDLVYSWQQLKEIRKFFNNPSAPSYGEHKEWFIKRLKKTSEPYLILVHEGKDIGAVSLTINSTQEYELSWYILPSYWGKGIGTAALELVKKYGSIHPIRAFVNKGNIASHKSFKKAGFKELGLGYYYYAE
ncbi:UDP-2,4-diacetamido-2,4,6-trideoxy-beta-L-altropyranose hydrolase [Candidatus Odyssella acanthamoebae]|uniref:UDP-2,4-diacetamido-2,4, 6-trideoxy-beta-L-altropyranose hydrolase n=1 Tax=Candidatus Odyssella acanthamoebae TaxID=91604 RepID=UPI00068AFA34|nr:UDP-2,4-diacetamido-2,4,6-trideoxy-beta-L-altropyranose hydrolase [Candidatus Paracaedibacter acanthamoebae]